MKFRGAEAIVETTEWEDTRAISKIRNPRSYRHPELEKRLVRERIRSEVRIIERLLSNGVPVPCIYCVDISNSQIIMEYIEGPTLEQALREDDFKKRLIETAELLSFIHSMGVIHGDPTTSNFMVKDKIYAIDFGLSTISDDSEDRSSDLRVFLESIDSHHSEINGRDIFLKSYSKWKGSAPVLKSLEVLELRGRYNLMRG